MFILPLILLAHIPQSDYLRCEDYDWLVKGVVETELLSPSQKLDFIIRWREHTDPSCFIINSEENQ